MYNGKILVSKGEDRITGRRYYRLLGGSIEFGETSEQAVVREIDEELASGIDNLTYLEAVESLFELDGKKGHEIAFVYKGDLTRKDLVEQPVVKYIEGKDVNDAYWLDLRDILQGDIPLYPAIDYTRFVS